ncbi:MAG: hypothetical protein QOC99_3229 [Acidobacteriota bacterium]|jgi:hypothetical protein|nr:hypothetical protein [Acidobacteriota bacterium]MDT7780717.1 hypothetical protein [Acidobacteriota bacterium]
MNTVTAIIATIVLATSIVYNTTTPTDETILIGPPATANAPGDTIEPGGPPPTFDDAGRPAPTCLACDH